MKENRSLPASIEQRLALAEQYHEQGMPERAENVMQEMARTLASCAPEMCALLLAHQFGKSGFGHYTENVVTEETRIPVRRFGFPIGEDIVTKTTTTRKIDEWRIF